MTPSSHSRWITVANQLGEIGTDLWKFSVPLEGWSSDPRMFSVMLYQRAWSNFKGFTLLWANHLNLESEILLRSCIEATICLRNLEVRREMFVADLRRDAADTLNGQMKLYSALGGDNLAAEAKAASAAFSQDQATGMTPKRLQLEKLAAATGSDIFYQQYKALSGTSAHVTGMSLITNVADAADGRAADEKAKADRETKREHALMVMCLTMHAASEAHATMVGHGESSARLSAMEATMEDIGAQQLAQRAEG